MRKISKLSRVGWIVGLSLFLATSTSATDLKALIGGRLIDGFGGEPLEDSVIPPEVAAYHLTHGSINLIRWWIENDQKYSTKEITFSMRRQMVPICTTVHVYFILL